MIKSLAFLYLKTSLFHLTLGIFFNRCRIPSWEVCLFPTHPLSLTQLFQEGVPLSSGIHHYWREVRNDLRCHSLRECHVLLFSFQFGDFIPCFLQLDYDIPRCGLICISSPWDYSSSESVTLSGNVFLWRFFCFSSTLSILFFWDSTSIFVHLFDMVPKHCRAHIKLVWSLFSVFRLNHFYFSVSKSTNSSSDTSHWLLSQFSKCFLSDIIFFCSRISSLYSIFKISYLSIYYNIIITLHLWAWW